MFAVVLQESRAQKLVDPDGNVIFDPASDIEDDGNLFVFWLYV
jgi:hypothetical protein